MPKPDLSEVRVKLYAYQPKKAELGEPAKIDTAPEGVARALIQPVETVEDADA